jgi:hypothetical protein
MMFFKCRISFNELVAMERYLPNDTYCISRDGFGEFHYGVIQSTGFNSLLNVLSGETLEQLEYLSSDEFKNVIAEMQNKSMAFYGNTSLLVQ